MVALRKRPKGVRYYGPFGLSVLVMSLVPTSIGYQDLVALMARQTEVSQRARAHMLTSPFGTIHAATFSFPQPVGTQIPEPPSYRLASFGPTDPEITGSLGANAPVPIHRPDRRFPDGQPQAQGRSAGRAPARRRSGLRDGHARSDARARQDRLVSETFRPSRRADHRAMPARAAPSRAPGRKRKAAPRAASRAATAPNRNAAIRLGRLYFGHSPFGEAVGTIQPWPSEEEVQIETPVHDLDIKRSALALPLGGRFQLRDAVRVGGGRRSHAVARGDAGRLARRRRETIAPKGEVTGAGKRPRTPAERLGLNAQASAPSPRSASPTRSISRRAARSKRGQIAVAQVVMNRVFSGYYPTNVCGVVYQNAHRHLACQFTFACDGIPDVVTEPDMWTQAKEIARDMLDGKLWLTEIGKSTHYHAYWVHPWLGQRDAQALQDRRAQLLSSAQLGRRLRSAAAQPVAGAGRDRSEPSEELAGCRITSPRHSGRAKRVPESITPVSVIMEIQGLWIPGSRPSARPGMTLRFLLVRFRCRGRHRGWAPNA